MNGNDLLNSLELVDPAYIEAADAPMQRRKYPWIKWVAMAACLAIVIATVALFPKEHSPQNPLVLPDDLPMLSLPADQNGMGDSCVMGYDTSDIIITNPWHAAMDIQTLPVWKNNLIFSHVQYEAGMNRDAMYALLWEIADRLGLSRENLTIVQAPPEGDDIYPMEASVADLVAQVDDMEIRIHPDLSVRILYANPYPIPNDLKISKDATYWELLALAQYLKKEFFDLLAMEDPQIDIQRDRNTFGAFGYSISFYEGADTPREKVLNYAFDRADIFYIHEDGIFSSITLYQQQNAEKVADYPIISMIEAAKLLCQGKHIPSPYPFPGTENIVGVELVYRTTLSDEYFMPYYCFYVHHPDGKLSDGLKTYAQYYVPAVHEKYLTNLTTWNGMLNG